MTRDGKLVGNSGGDPSDIIWSLSGNHLLERTDEGGGEGRDDRLESNEPLQRTFTLGGQPALMVTYAHLKNHRGRLKHRSGAAAGTITLLTYMAQTLISFLTRRRTVAHCLPTGRWGVRRHSFGGGGGVLHALEAEPSSGIRTSRNRASVSSLLFYYMNHAFFLSNVELYEARGPTLQSGYRAVLVRHQVDPHAVSRWLHKSQAR